MAQFCEHCGTPLHMTDQFCPGCGRPVASGETRPSGGAAAAGEKKTGYQSAGGQKDWDAFRSAGDPPVYYAPETGREMTVGNWIVTLLITCIPIAGFIMLIVWAVGGSPKFPARRNWAIAQFVIMAVFIALGIVLTAIAGFSLASMMNSGTLS
ncbi:MAG: zinc ribbon domain-containing protein [Firmicutes bacterium]|nr:zinc ribbon domain-containing protein [Bacillota bacterium]